MGSAKSFGRAVLDLAIDRMRVSAMQVEAMRANSYLDHGPPALKDIAQRAFQPSRPHGDMADGAAQPNVRGERAHFPTKTQRPAAERLPQREKIRLTLGATRWRTGSNPSR